MAVIAKWRKGARFTADPELVASEIMAIGDEVSPRDVLEVARDEDTELHKCFEWDDTVAAERYRLTQAREVIRFLVIKEEQVPVERPEVRFFYKIDTERGYEPTHIIVRDEDKYKALLEQAYAELRRFKAKYSMLEELSEIFELID